MKNVDAKFIKSKYVILSELGTRFNLSFSSQLVFGNKIIALDGIKKSVLVLDTGVESKEPLVIDLNKIATVTVKKTYGSINHGELGNKGIEEFLTRIDLLFESYNNETIVLPFYDSETDNKKECAMLGRNAKNWQMILSKMVGSQTDESIKKQNEFALVQLPLPTPSYT
jgi:hypothetical protein